MHFCVFFNKISSTKFIRQNGIEILVKKFFFIFTFDLRKEWKCLLISNLLYHISLQPDGANL